MQGPVFRNTLEYLSDVLSSSINLDTSLTVPLTNGNVTFNSVLYPGFTDNILVKEYYLVHYAVDRLFIRS